MSLMKNQPSLLSRMPQIDHETSIILFSTAMKAVKHHKYTLDSKCFHEYLLYKNVSIIDQLSNKNWLCSDKIKDNIISYLLCSNNNTTWVYYNSRENPVLVVQI
jgi:hypothetical protein